MRHAIAIALLVALALSAAAAARNDGTVKRRCRVVTRIVHGKKRRVRVCKKKPSLPAAGSVAATVTLPGNAIAQAIAATDSAVWIVSNDNRLFRIDPATNRVVATLTLPDSEWPEANVAVGDGAVWITVASPSTVSQPELDSLIRIDPSTNQIVTRIHVGHSPIGIAIGPESVWTANHRAEWDNGSDASTGVYDVSRVDLASGYEVARPVVETRPTSGDPNSYWCCGPQGMTYAAGSVWTGDTGAGGHGTVIRIDPASNAVLARISLDASKAAACGTFAGDELSVWFTSGCDRTFVGRIDPQTNRVAATIDLGSPSADIALGFGSVWATSTTALNKINPATNKIVARSTVISASALATGAGSIWVGSGRKVLRLKPH